MAAHALIVLFNFCLEVRPVAKHNNEQLTSVEKEVIADIRYRRRLPLGDPGRATLSDPVLLVRNFIEAKHASVQLHIGPIAQELGIELRTLERNFADRYGKDMRQHQVDVRLAFCKTMLRTYPITRIREIVDTLGYKEVRAFNQFFSDHMGQAPTKWAAEEQERMRQIKEIYARDGYLPES